MLIDSSLREGDQLFAAYVDQNTRQAIAETLARVGVEELELGCVGRQGLAELLAALRPSARGRTALAVWSPLSVSWIRKAAELGPDRLNIGAPVSEGHYAKRLGLSRRGLLDRLEQALSAALAVDSWKVTVGLEDASRADPEFALEAARLARDLGASRIRISDTVGRLSPLEMARLVENFARTLDGVELAAHCHNDFGLATANALSALDAGADYADVSLLGAGERSGIAATEELALWLNLRRGREYKLELLRPLCRLMSRACGLEISRTKAVAGEDIFACESGLHVHGIARDPALYEPYPPELLGVERRLAVGAKSGRAAVLQALTRLGVAGEDGRPAFANEELDALVASVRSRSMELGRPLEDGELVALAVEVWRSSAGARG